MTVTQEIESNINPRNWGMDRVVEIQKGSRLGFSIIGGKIDVPSGDADQKTSGVFIKSVDPDAAVSDVGNLRIGDRIVEVNGINILNSTYDKVVEIIEKNEDTIRLRVQSLTLTDQSTGGQRIGSKLNEKQKSSSADRPSVQKTLSTHAEAPPSKETDETSTAAESKIDRQKSVQENEVKRVESEESSEEEEDDRYLEGKINTAAGMEISRKSAGNVKRSAAEIAADPDQEDEYGYTNQKVQKKYRALKGQKILVTLDKQAGDLGIALAGHKDRQKMAVFICGLNPKGTAYKDGNLKVGDEILEVNGNVIQGRCHLNASVIIKGLGGTILKIVVVRVENSEIAVKPLTHFPAALDESDRWGDFEGVRTVSLKKGMYGLGIMIVEGKHAVVGQGIFISDIQEGSVAEKGGLLLGDMLLCVNSDSLVGVTYDQATAILKRVEGMVTVSVCNPNQNKEKEEAEKKEAAAKAAAAKSGDGSGQAVGADGKPAEAAVDPKSVKPPKGKPVTVELTRAKDAALGLIVTGGSNTSSGGVFILDLYPDSIAGKSEHLKRGDQILEFCQEKFQAVERERAEFLVLSATGAIKMSVLQDDPPIEEVEVELNRKPLKGIGLGLTGFKCGKGAYISELMAGGSAAESGKLELGDIILAIGGQNVEETETDEIANIMKASTPVQLKIKRFKAKPA